MTQTTTLATLRMHAAILNRIKTFCNNTVTDDNWQDVWVVADSYVQLVMPELGTSHRQKAIMGYLTYIQNRGIKSISHYKIMIFNGDMVRKILYIYEPVNRLYVPGVCKETSLKGARIAGWINNTAYYFAHQYVRAPTMIAQRGLKSLTTINCKVCHMTDFEERSILEYLN